MSFGILLLQLVRFHASADSLHLMVHASATPTWPLRKHIRGTLDKTLGFDSQNG